LLLDWSGGTPNLPVRYGFAIAGVLNVGQLENA